jgi:NodT family efflux transporter outer membrane factor (OMF) lipoprotein
MNSLMLILALSSCSLLRVEPEAVTPKVLPQAYAAIQGVDAPAQRWWEDLGSEELNGLIASAFAENLSLAQALARFKQVQASAVKAGAGRIPSLNATAGAGRTRTVTRPGRDSGLTDVANDERISTTVKSFSYGLAASYELDLWGRVRDGRMAAGEDEAAAKANAEAAAMTLAAEVTSRWLRLIEQRKQVTLLQRQLKVNRANLENIEGRLRKGQATALDVYQQKQTVAQVEAKIPLAEASQELTRHALNLLLGRPASAELSVVTESLPALPKAPRLGIPAHLLVQRPDVRAALHTLNAADWRVAAARADRFPAIRLTGTYTHSSDKTSRLFENWALNLAESLTAPLIDGRQRSAEVARTRAVVEERVAAYRESLLQAVKEVEDAALQEAKYRAHLKALHGQLEAARNAYTTAWERYRRGQSTYLSTQVALVAVQQNERDELRVRRELIDYRIALYRALGGTWSRELLEDLLPRRRRATILPGGRQ